MSAAVDETGMTQGRSVRSRYWMDVCPSSEGALRIVRRDLQLVAINGVAPSPEMTEKLKNADADMPDWIVDPSGAFVEDNPWSAWRLADLWQGWVELWLHVDPKRGSPQEVSSPNIANGVATLVTYTGLTDDHRARFEGRRRLSKDEVWQMIKDSMLKRGISDVQAAKMTRDAEETVEIETDWPAVRPWSVHSKRTVHFVNDEYVEDRQQRFDWRAPKDGRPTCPGPKKAE